MVLGMNKALCELGINPNSIDNRYRQAVQQLAIENGSTVQEAATFIFYQLSIGMQPIEADAVIARWVRDGKVREQVIDEARRAKLMGDGMAAKLMDGMR